MSGLTQHNCTCSNHNNQAGRRVPVLNAVLRADPTRTLTLRNRFLRDMNRRFNALAEDIIQTIVNNDAFGLDVVIPIRLQAAGPRAFAFDTDSQKIEAFMTWLQEQQNNRLLEVFTVPDPRFPGVQPAWTNTYIQSSYQKGFTRARSELRKEGFDVPDTGLDIIQATSGRTSTLATAFNSPVHADRAGIMFTRTFEGVKGIADDMRNVVRRELTQGIIEGRNPRELAKVIVDKVKGRSLARARTLARTEIVNAHHQAMMQEYENFQVEGVRVLAEWSTAGDDRVCPDCAALEGKIFTMPEIRNLIPLHPNCRCIAIPVDLADADQVADARTRRATVRRTLREQGISARDDSNRAVERRRGQVTA